MTEHMDDRKLLELLARSLESTDPIPEHVSAAAREAIMWRTIDAELAELVFDSAVDELVGLRSGAGDRQVTFRAPGVEIEVAVMGTGNRELIGQLVPPQSATIELRQDDTVRETGTDRLGRFSFTDVPAGSVSIVVTTEDGTRIATEWMVI